MNDIAIFTDVSLDPGRKIGVGAYLILPAALLTEKFKDIDRIKMRRFEDTSSVKLEVQTVLWALEEYHNRPKLSRRGKLYLYTDSQCVSGLLKRSAGLLASNFISKNTKQSLRNSEFYRAFYELHDELGFEVIKVKGHSKASLKNNTQCIFSFVDKEARKALREWAKELSSAAKDLKQKVQNKNWCVYVLRCSNDYFYIGITNDIKRRLKEHELGRGSKFVRSWRPFELIKTIPCENGGEARKLEYSLKRLTRKKKIEVLGL